MSPKYILFGVLLALALAGSLSLAEPAPPPEEVTVSVVVVLASNQGHTVDPRLKCVAREVQKVNPKLTNFKMERMTCKSVVVGATERFVLVEDQAALVTVEQAADRDNRIQVKVAPPMLGEITYATCCGKFLPIITRHLTRNDELLLLAVRVQPCHGNK
jgi:hypothetical protein